MKQVEGVTKEIVRKAGLSGKLLPHIYQQAHALLRVS